MSKKEKIIYNPPIDVYYEFQYVLNEATDFLNKKNILEMKPKVDEKRKAFLNELGIITFSDLLIAKKDVVEKIYQDQKLFRFIIEAFHFLYEKYERDKAVFYGKKAISIIINGEDEFLQKPINVFLSPRNYVRTYNAFKRHKKYKIVNYFDLKRYINDQMDMLTIRGIGVSCEISLLITIIVDYKYWRYLKNI